MFLVEKDLLPYLWHLYSHLPNDLAFYNTLFGLSSSKQNIGLAGFLFFCFFCLYRFMHQAAVAALNLALCSFFSYRRSAL